MLNIISLIFFVLYSEILNHLFIDYYWILRLFIKYDIFYLMKSAYICLIIITISSFSSIFQSWWRSQEINRATICWPTTLLLKIIQFSYNQLLWLTIEHFEKLDFYWKKLPCIIECKHYKRRMIYRLFIFMP